MYNAKWLESCGGCCTARKLCSDLSHIMHNVIILSDGGGCSSDLAVAAAAPQVAEGVATAGVVVSLARKYRVSLPVLTAVAQVLDNNLTPAQAVAEIMSLPQIEEH